MGRLRTPAARVTSTTRDQWRYGSRGSLAVNVQHGTWYDHEQGVGGGVIDLIHRETGLADGAAVEWLRTELGIASTSSRSRRPSAA